MQDSVKAITITSALLWGGCMLAVGLIHLADASYGEEFLRVMSSIYPGVETSRTIGRTLLGTVYGAVDGAIAGYLFASLYQLFTRGHRSAH